MRRHRIIWILAFAVAIGTAAVVLCRSALLPVVTLADGTRLTVRRVTVSRHPTMCFGNPLQRLGAKFPGKLGDKLSGGTKIQFADQGQPVLAIWFSWETTNKTIPPLMAYLKSTDDVTWGVEQTRLRRLGTVPGLNGCLRIPAWPRREKQVTVELRLRDAADKGTSLGRFTVANPAYGSYSQGKPESLPAVRRTANAEFTLNSVSVLTDPHRQEWISSFGGYGRSARVSVSGKEPGQAGAWHPARMVMADATGNRIGMGMSWATTWAKHFDLDDPDLRYDWPAMPGEEAVKLRVEFMKTYGYRSNELFVIRGLTMGSLRRGDFVTNTAAGRIVFSAIGNKSRALVLMPPDESDPTETGYSSRRFVLVSVRDDQGRQYKIYLHFSATIEWDAKALDIIVAAPAMTWVEWTVPARGSASIGQ